jgi:pre-rRNA-processing protein TSR1
MMSKIDRRHHARQLQALKHKETVRATDVFNGRNGAPRIVALIPLCQDGDAHAAATNLNKSLDLGSDLTSGLLAKTSVDRFKQKLEYIMVPRDLMAAIDAARTADFVVFILSPDEEVDELGELMLRTIESQGVSNSFTVIQGLNAIQPVKKQSQVSSSLKSYIKHFFPATERVYSLDSFQESSNLMRSLCTTTPKGIKWREERSWMLVESMERSSDTDGVILTGVVRGKGLNPDRLVQVGDWGDFQIESIKRAAISSTKENEMAVDEEIIAIPTEDQDELDELAPEELMEDDAMTATVATTVRKGVLLDDHHYFSDDEEHLPQKPKKLPKGTSNYQAAWYLDDMSFDSDSDMEDVVDEDGDMAMGAPALPQDGAEGLAGPEATEYATTVASQSEMFMDPSPEDEEEQLEAFRSRNKTEAEEDLEFPDEIELHPNVLARERLIKYRGLKSLRTSTWETDEDKLYEPEDWERLLKIMDYKGALNRVSRETLIGGVMPGTRVHVHLKNVPDSVSSTYDPSRPLAMFSLLRHEHKRTVVNTSLTLSSEQENPLRSKEEIIVQCGPRRFVINPVFSQSGHTSNNVYKMEKFVHPGRTTSATFVAPLTWGPVPCLYFRQKAVIDSAASPSLELIGTGTNLPPSHSRVIAKRIILTGHPYKINKRVVTIRYMFFNDEDVAWFKALTLWTKRGRSGFIKESLGTHGYFKATFDGKLNPQDSIGVSLYKRVFPRSARVWKGLSDVTETDDMEAEETVPKLIAGGGIEI